VGVEDEKTRGMSRDMHPLLGLGSGHGGFHPLPSHTPPAGMRPFRAHSFLMLAPRPPTRALSCTLVALLQAAHSCPCAPICACTRVAHLCHPCVLPPTCATRACCRPLVPPVRAAANLCHPCVLPPTCAPSRPPTPAPSHAHTQAARILKILNDKRGDSSPQWWVAGGVWAWVVRVMGSTLSWSLRRPLLQSFTSRRFPQSGSRGWLQRAALQPCSRHLQADHPPWGRSCSRPLARRGNPTL